MTHPDNIQIECFLEGFDQRWRNVTDTRRSTYTNVPPGEYVLKVRHAEADGEWRDEERMTIVVRYPWYLSVWALVLWGLLASGIIITVWRLRKHYVVQREKAAEAQREKRMSGDSQRLSSISSPAYLMSCAPPASLSLHK